jgi:hypothetical protein
MNIINSIVKLKNRIIYNKFSKFAHPQKFKWQWDEKLFNRIALINFLVSKTGGWECAYLEIGCNKDTLFNSVAVQSKIGVDPLIGGTHRMTSDEFFKENKKMFDVIFIDGLHEYAQVRKDALNALNVLNEGGWIIFHDFLPVDWKMQHVPRMQSTWNGDVWKAAIELNNAVGLNLQIIKIDQGMGVLRKLSNDFEIPDMYEDLIRSKFSRFVTELPNLSTFEFEEFIENISE